MKTSKTLLGLTGAAMLVGCGVFKMSVSTSRNAGILGVKIDPKIIVKALNHEKKESYESYAGEAIRNYPW